MACEKGCVDGPGNLIKAVVAKKLVKDFADKAEDFADKDEKEKVECI